jgi:hypothetical protein
MVGQPVVAAAKKVSENLEFFRMHFFTEIIVFSFYILNSLNKICEELGSWLNYRYFELTLKEPPIILSAPTFCAQCRISGSRTHGD